MRVDDILNTYHVLRNIKSVPIALCICIIIEATQQPLK